MIVGSTKEDISVEKRVSITPETAKSIIALGLDVCIEKNYAKHLGISDHAFQELGVKILNSSGQQDTLKLNIPRSKYPIFINDDDGKQEFYVRSNATAKSPKIINETAKMRYYKEHFPDWKP